MRATGIIRRVDDLGRVVLPKEVRRTLRIREGDPLEIFIDTEGAVILKKHSTIGCMEGFAGTCAKSLYKTTGYSILVTDNDTVIAGEGLYKKPLVGRHLDEKYTNLLYSSDMLVESNMSCVVEEQSVSIPYTIIKPIVIDGDVAGSIILASSNPISGNESIKHLLNNMASFIAFESDK